MKNESKYPIPEEFIYAPGFRPEIPYVNSYEEARNVPLIAHDVWEWAVKILDEYEADKNVDAVGARKEVCPVPHITKKEYSLKAEIWPLGFDKQPVEVSARGLQTLDGYKTTAIPELSAWGGDANRRVNATGFFHVEKSGGRFWLADPEGYLCYHTGIAAVNINESPRIEENAVKEYGSTANWANRTAKRLREIGFNATGAWSNERALENCETPVGICGMCYFITIYADQNGATESSVGHKTFSQNNTIPVFDPAFEKFAFDYAEERTESFRNKPKIVGWFSDNELPANYNALDRYLTLNPGKEINHYSLAVAWEFVKRETGLPNPVLDDITGGMYLKFRGLVANRYFRVVSGALKAADPNHLYLGCRFMYLGRQFVEGTLLCESMLEAAGRWCDVVSINYYMDWTPDPEAIRNWCQWSGKPFIITEWYAMARDSKLKCSSGAGFRVNTQAERGIFYQNFALALLECPFCVGFHWFKYMDNDPDFTEAEASNRDGNKGIVSSDFEEWTCLTNAMKELNDQIYPLISYFDTVKTP